MSDPVEIQVLLPVFNSAATIAGAIQSVLDQTFNRFELLLCDDGSTDNTKDVIQRFKDPRVKVISHPVNLGISEARNTLLGAADAPYICWLDADDKMMNSRISEQLKWLKAHPEIDVAGSYIVMSGAQNGVKRTITNPDQIAAMLLFRNCIFQPSVISKNFYKEEQLFYTGEFDYLEDYHLWWNLLLKGKRFGCVPEYLTNYTVPDPEKRNVFKFTEKHQKLTAIRFSSLGLDLPENEMVLFSDFSKQNRLLSREESYILLGILRRLKSNKQMLSFTKRGVLNSILMYYCLRLSRNSQVTVGPLIMGEALKIFGVNNLTKALRHRYLLR